MSSVKQWHFDSIYTSTGWMNNVYFITDNNGIIQDISPQPKIDLVPQHISHIALPSFINSHSHAFQYGIAGLTEYLNPNNTSDDFWSWRKAMYQSALNLEPHEIKEIAQALYKEMILQGYSHVVEFHYLHNDPKGAPYNNPMEISEQLIQAALEAGIKITLIPIYYNQGGINRKPEDQQRRFITKNIDQYLKNMESLKDQYNDHPHITIGVGPHSLRAVNKEDLIEIFRHANVNTPLHIHISEQTQEVEECLQHYGLRPVEWLAENTELNSNMNLVHATHLQAHEILTITQSKAQVVLCPSTEANLGDGIFSLTSYIQNNGSWCIGTDSHIGINPFEELRWLEYTQRLTHKKRNPLCSKENNNSGDLLVSKSQISGLKSAGQNFSFLTLGSPLDFIAMNKKNDFLLNCPQNSLLSQLVFNSQSCQLIDHVINGEYRVKDRSYIFNNKKNLFSHVLSKIQNHHF